MILQCKPSNQNDSYQKTKLDFMSEAYSISYLTEIQETTKKKFAFTIINKILKIKMKGYYIQKLTRRYET